MKNEDINPNFYRSPLGVVHERNPKPKYPRVIALFTPTSHDTSWLYCREDGTYYWEHVRKNKDKVTEDVNGLQLDLFGKPILTKEFIMRALFPKGS
tara:strand:+ start:284 stop:571 length:288 start_codon:yes stop_codon:yes gene_type:complete